MHFHFIMRLPCSVYFLYSSESMLDAILFLTCILVLNFTKLLSIEFLIIRVLSTVKVTNHSVIHQIVSSSVSFLVLSKLVTVFDHSFISISNPIYPEVPKCDY